MLYISINVCAESNKVHCGTAHGVLNMVYLGINLHAAQITLASNALGMPSSNQSHWGPPALERGGIQAVLLEVSFRETCSAAVKRFAGAKHK